MNKKKFASFLFLIILILPSFTFATFQADPSSFRFIHETIAPTFSLENKGHKTKENSLLKAIKKIDKKELDPLAFPAIKIFTIQDPKSQELKTYSLSNRRLYIFKKSKTTNVNVTNASFKEVLEALDKMSSQSDGARYPRLTKNPGRANEPKGTLGQFKSSIETYRNLLEKTWNKKNKDTIEVRLHRFAIENFHFR